MKTFHNQAHHLHAGKQEMFRGKLVDCHEVPDRLEYVLAELKRRQMGDIVAPADDLPVQAALEAIHTREYLAFLARAWDDWVQLDPANAQRDALPSVWPLSQPHAFRTDAPPFNFAARLGQYAFDSGTPLTAGSWRAARQGVLAARLELCAGWPARRRRRGAGQCHRRHAGGRALDLSARHARPHAQPDGAGE